jgi:hypothetical protein
MLRELARGYLTVVKDRTRVMSRVKALYRSWVIPCAGRDVYDTRHRSQWLDKIPEPGVRYRAEQLCQQLSICGGGWSSMFTMTSKRYNIHG